MLESFTAWLTPTSLFLLLNIVIGTIWLTSHLTTHHHTKQHHHLHHQADHFYSSPPLARAPSLVDRVKSINFGLYKYDPHHSDDYFPPAEQVYAKIKAQQAASAPPPLARAPSLLDRVKSVNFNDFQFSFFRSEFHHSEPHVHLQTQYEQEPLYPVQRREPEPHVLLEKQHEYKPVADPYPVQRREPKRQVQLETQHEYEPVTVQRREQTGSDLRSRALARAPSLLERVKSINLNDLHLHQFLPFRSEIPIPGPKFSGPEPVLDREPGHYSEDHHVRRSKSDDRKVSRGGSRTAEKKMKKSASEKRAFAKQAEEEDEEVERRRPATSRVERTVSIGGDVEVDAKADDFINKFKQQLQLQRLDSILQYKDMITRGASK